MKVRYTGDADVREVSAEDLGVEQGVRFDEGNQWTAAVDDAAGDKLLALGDFEKLEVTQEADATPAETVQASSTGMPQGGEQAVATDVATATPPLAAPGASTTGTTGAVGGNTAA